MQGYGRDESAPTPGGMFAAHFVGERWCFAECSPRIRNPFEMPSRNVRNVFVLCTLHIRRAKVWFLRHKSMVFGVQEVGFCKALISRWLHCFCVSGRCSNTINVRNRRYS